MSVLAFTDGDLFRITIVKRLAANPDRLWANNYELRAKIDGVTTDLTEVGLRLVDLERTLHYATALFDRLRISTWEPDSKPYDPTTFIALPLAVAGNRTTASIEVEPLNLCWDVARVPLSGRFGHAYYRHALGEFEVNAPAGKANLLDPANSNSILAAGITGTSVDTILDGSDPVWELVMVGKTSADVRQVAALTSRGVAVVPFNHAWFNRTTPP